LVGKSTVLENDVAYIRVARVEEGLAREVSSKCEQLGATNKLKGVVLDLRFTAGDDYEAAAATADLFVPQEQPLLDWGGGVVKSRKKEDAIKLPVAALVNRETTGAAEALAAVLRETGTGLILGNRTAGGAMVGQEFPLRNGQKVRIATLPVKLGDGSALSAQGLKPDIEVAVNADDERAYFADAFAQPRTNATSVLALSPSEVTNRPPRRPRISEADLVRERRDGTNLNTDDFTAVRDREPEKPLIRDPALARAVDLLKGLAVVRRARS
jgi:C-terminal processing protease CtpA/Prc